MNRSTGRSARADDGPTPTGGSTTAASAASIAGLLKLAELGEIDRDERVVCICTGHVLKDPDTIIKSFGKVHQAKADLVSVKACMSAKD